MYFAGLPWKYMVLAIILSVVCAIVLFLLITPIVLEVDSERGKYQVCYRGIGSCNAVIVGGRLLFILHLLGWKKTIDPFAPRINKNKPEKPKRSKTRRRMTPSKMLRKARAVLRSFRVQYFYVDVDTDNYVTNAWLYPIAMLGRSSGGPWIHINFSGETVVRLRIQNSVGRMLYAVIRK